MANDRSHRDPRDRVELSSVPTPRAEATRRSAANAEPARKKFLQIWYRCCHTYGRLTRNRDNTAFEGRCPSCGARCEAKIGHGGSTRRAFEAG
ncbi:MAG: hypothetical protein JNM94_13875 [Phycisphaerae bacterium]|nr:hypothetical protein [Phycisphaerae bacterium]